MTTTDATVRLYGQRQQPLETGVQTIVSLNTKSVRTSEVGIRYLKDDVDSIAPPIAYRNQ